MRLVEVGGSIYEYMEAHASFHGIHSWKPQLMEAMEASTSTDSENFHVLPWKLLPTSMEFAMEVNLLPPTSMKASIEVNSLPWKFPWKLVENLMEVDRAQVGGHLWKSC